MTISRMWPILKRFSEAEIESLLEIKWWDWETDKLTRNVGFLTGNDVESLQKLK